MGGRRTRGHSARFHAGERLPGVGEAVDRRAQPYVKTYRSNRRTTNPGPQRGSGFGDAQAPARHAWQAASVEGALLGLDGGHEHEAQ